MPDFPDKYFRDIDDAERLNEAIADFRAETGDRRRAYRRHAMRLVNAMRAERDAGRAALRAAAQRTRAKQVTATLCAVALSGCVSVTIPPTSIGHGATACLVRGLGGPLTSYLTAGESALEAMGYRVEVHDMLASPADLIPCAVIVAHSAGAVPALRLAGYRQIFIIDRAPWAPSECPLGAQCTNYYALSGPLGGARNVNCFTSCSPADAIPLIGHLTMPASQAVWRDIEQSLSHTVTADKIGE